MGKGTAVVDKRVRDLLDYHISLLERGKNRFEAYPAEQAYYLTDVPWEREDDYVRIGYKKRKSKLLTKTFDLEFSTSVNQVWFDDSFQLRINFRGFPNIQDVFFKGEKGTSEYAYDFNDAGLLAIIKKYAKIVDVGYIVLDYNAYAKRVTVRVCPYAGAYLWVVFPPVFYKIPLKQEEADALWKITMEIRKYICKHF